ncbi:MAG: hypothetical protein SFV54_15315 [Bryobacteraceae bacterium]|nr:hypothetical protein [Bryobacteraceae bacterium]
MKRFRFRTTRAAVVCLLAATVVSQAVETQLWTHSQQDDFLKGTLKKLSVRSDGRLFLAPVFTEIFDPSAAYLWAVAEDSKGRVYVGGGGPDTATTRLFRIEGGKGQSIADLPGLSIQAIAIDRQDRVYAATSPDGMVYRLDGNGKPQVFYEPKSKYIWGMAFHPSGDLFVATGDQGELHRVDANGKGAVFFKSEETHLRSLAVDREGNLVVGTEPGGLIVRVSPKGEGLVLYQAPKREVTAVAAAPDGSLYAAAVGVKGPSLAPPPAAPAPVPSPTPAAGQGVVVLGAAPRPAAAPPPTLTPATGVSGGSEVYRIGKDGYPRRVWSHAQDVVYAIAFDSEGRAVVGTGNKGNLYRLDSDVRQTLLTTAAPTQVTAMAPARGGGFYVVTGNIGKVFRLGPGLEKSGSYESEPLDAGSFSDWGRLDWTGSLNGGGVVLETRSGNLDRPQQNWSGWMKAASRMESPAARFLQYRVTLAAGGDGRSPEVRSVEAAYQSRNIGPVVSMIEATPFNYKFPPQSLTLTPSTSITLPAIGGKRTPPTVTVSSSQTMQFAKGWVGARWQASDENGDVLSYRVEIRAVNEREWKLLKEDLDDRQYSWDSTAFPDGEYVLRVTASDAPDNPKGKELAGELVGEPFVVDNTAPELSAVQVARKGSVLQVRWSAADALTPIEKAEYSVNGGEWTLAPPTTTVSDSLKHEYVIEVEAKGGEQVVTVRVWDRNQNVRTGGGRG